MSSEFAIHPSLLSSPIVYTNVIANDVGGCNIFYTKSRPLRTITKFTFILDGNEFIIKWHNLRL